MVPRRSPRHRPKALVATAVATAVAVILGALGAWAPPGGGAVTRARAGGTRLLLALGDSLAAGYRPTDGHRPPPVDPATGRRDGGYPGGYAADVSTALHLRLVDLGCPGETTASFSSRPARADCRRAYEATTGAANQLRAALAELSAHRGQVAAVTFDLGGNDLAACVAHGALDGACLARLPGVLARRLPRLLTTIDHALARDDPGAPLVAMTYYDPFLALAYRPGGLRGEALAAASLAGLAAVNAALTALYRRAGVLVAPVATAFSTGALLPLATYGGRRLPRDVAAICRLTYMCPRPGAPAGTPAQNVHPTTKGYATIAHAFERVLRPQQA